MVRPFVTMLAALLMGSRAASAEEPAHQEWKEKVLSGAIALEEVDTRPFNMPSNQTPTTKKAPAAAS